MFVMLVKNFKMHQSDALKVNKVIKHLKSTKRFIKVPKFDKESLKLQLFTKASFNNLTNGGSQAGQILFLSDCKNNCFPLHWNSSKLKREVWSTLAAETLSLSDGCDVTFYVDILLSELILIIAYTDNQSLHDTVHSTKQTLERRLIVDTSSIHEMVDNNQIQVIWVEKDKQISDVLTKSGVSQKSLLNILETGKMLSM